MNKIIFFAIALLYSTSGTFAAATVPEPPPPIPKGFVTQLAAGIDHRDLAAIAPLVHPDTRRCMTPETADYYAFWLWKDGSKRYTVPEQYRITPQPPLDVTAAESALKTQPAPLLHWPAQPDAAFHLIYNPAPTSIMERLFEVTLKNGQALLVMDCPTQAGLAAFREQQAARARQAQKLDRIWKSMAPQDRQAFSLMAKQGLKLDGMKAAEQKYHLDTGESLALMDMAQYADTP